MTRRWLTLAALLLAAFWSPLTSRAGGETPIHSDTMVALGDWGGGIWVALTWNPSSGTHACSVKRAASSGGPNTLVASTGGTSYTDTGLTNGATYYYVVTAGNTGGESPNSNQVSATPVGPPPPAAPTKLTTAAGKKKVDLKWTQSVSSGVTQNQVYRSTTSGGGYSLRATLSATTSLTDTSVPSGKTYHYVVTAVNGSTGKESAYSNQAAAKAR